MAKSGIIEQGRALRAGDSRDALALTFRLSEGSEQDLNTDYSAPPPAAFTHGF